MTKFPLLLLVVADLMEDEYIMGRHRNCGYIFEDKADSHYLSFSNRHCRIFRVSHEVFFCLQPSNHWSRQISPVLCLYCGVFTTSYASVVHSTCLFNVVYSCVSVLCCSNMTAWDTQFSLKTQGWFVQHSFLGHINNLMAIFSICLGHCFSFSRPLDFGELDKVVWQILFVGGEGNCFNEVVVSSDFFILSCM